MAENNYIIHLLDGSLITLSPDQIELYPTIKEQIEYLVSGPGNIVDINYPNPKALYQLLTNPNEALAFDSFLQMIEAVDYVGNDDILNRLLSQMASIFIDTSFTNATKNIKENMIDLVYKLKDTVIYRFLQLIQTIKLDYEISPDPYLTGADDYIVNDDLNTSLIVKGLDFDPHNNYTGVVFNKNTYINMIAMGTIEEEETLRGVAIDNTGDVYSPIISQELIFDIDYPFLEVDPEIGDFSFGVTKYIRNIIYESSLLLEYNFVAKLSQGAKRYALISNLDEEEEEGKEEEDIYDHFSILQLSDNQSLAMFELPRGKYERNKTSGTQFPLVSPNMKIVMWQLPIDITNSRYRITAIDLPQKPTFFIDNIDDLHIPPYEFKNWQIGTVYVLFNSNEDKLLVVRKTVDGHQASLMTDRGQLLMDHLFTAEVPLFLVKDMIITVSDQLDDIKFRGNILWQGKSTKDPAIDTNSRLTIWYTRGVSTPIPVYDKTFVPFIKDYMPWSIGKVYTGIKVRERSSQPLTISPKAKSFGDSILLTLIYRKINKKSIDKYV